MNWQILNIPMKRSRKSHKHLNKLSYILNNLNLNTTYSIMIRSRNEIGWSKLSEENSFNTFPLGTTIIVIQLELDSTLSQSRIEFELNLMFGTAE